MSRFTIDANVLVYGFDLRAGPRHGLAREIIAAAKDCDCHLTLQVIGEFYAVLTRKRKIAAEDAARWAIGFSEVFPTIAQTRAAVRSALADAAAGRLSYWDALILATAAEAGCSAILTEDMADGARIVGVEIINPFAGDRIAPRAAALLASASL